MTIDTTLFLSTRIKTAMRSFQNKLSLKKRKPPELNNVAVMASKGLGKVWSFNIYFPLLLGIVVVIVLYFLFSFVLVARYLSEQQQESLLVQLEKDFKETERDLYQAKQRLKFLENYIDPSKIPVESLKGTIKSTPSEHGAPSSSDKTFLKESEAGTQESIISIEGLKINSRGANLSVTFNLTRSRSARSSIRGYVFIIAVDNATDPPLMWSSPKAAFKDGLPVDPKKGRAYKIRNFRQIRARWSFEAPEKMPTELKILVYDGAGHLLLKKDFHLEKKQPQ